MTWFLYGTYLLTVGYLNSYFHFLCVFQDWPYTASYANSVPETQKLSIVPPLSVKNYNAIEEAAEE